MGVGSLVRDIYERNHVGFTGKFNAMQICNRGKHLRNWKLKWIKYYIYTPIVYTKSRQIFSALRWHFEFFYFIMAGSRGAFEFFYPSTVFQFSFYPVQNRNWKGYHVKEEWLNKRLNVYSIFNIFIYLYIRQDNKYGVCSK